MYITNPSTMNMIQSTLENMNNDEKTTILSDFINNMAEDDIANILFNIISKNTNVINRIIKISDIEQIEIIDESKQFVYDTPYYSYYNPIWESSVSTEIINDMEQIPKIVDKYGYENLYNTMRVPILYRMEYEAHENYSMSFEDFDVPVVEVPIIELSEDKINDDINNIINNANVNNISIDDTIKILTNYAIANNLAGTNPISKRIFARSPTDINTHINNGNKICSDNNDCNNSKCKFIHVPIM